MQVSVEKINNIERRLTITVPANQVEEAYTKQINLFAKNAKIKGFRPGKVPLAFVEQRFGEEARKEALGNLIQEALSTAISEQNLKPISTPHVTPKKFLPQEPLEFIASFEVLPEIEKVNFSLDKVEKLIISVEPTDVDFAIAQLQKQYGTWKIVQRPAQEKDRVVIDYYPVIEGIVKSDEKVEQFALELGSHLMIPGFEEGLIGANVNDERTLNLQFPEDFHLKDQAGKKVDFFVTIKQIYEAEIPFLDETFIKKLGIKSGQEEDLKKQVKQTLEFERDRIVKEKLKEQVFAKLLEDNTIDVPKSLVDQLSKKMHDDIYQHQPDHDHKEDEMIALNDVATKRVAVGLLISAFAKQFNLKADKARVHTRVQEIAAAYEKPAEVEKWLLSGERIGDIEAQVLEDQVLDKLLTDVSVTEKKLSYSELKGLRSNN